MKIELSPDLKLPLDAVTQTFAFLARRGAGKTYGAMKLAEEFLTASAQVVALDPVGVWFGLRLDAHGKGKGFDIPVFGGEHGDIPLEPTGGAFVARAIVEHGISVVLDVSHFRKGQRKQFCTDFAEELFHLKKKHRSPMHLFVEEAQVFVPQRTMHGEERMLGAFEDIIKLGRNYGIGATLISQRPQAVNKDVLNQTECLVVLQTNGAQERAALKLWMQEKSVAPRPMRCCARWRSSSPRCRRRARRCRRSRYSCGRRSPAPPSPVDAGEVTGSQQRVLDALAWFEAFGITQPTREALAPIAQTRPTSGGFKNNLGALRSAGLIDYPAEGRVALTDAGRSNAHPVPFPPTNEGMQAAACSVVTNAQAAILRMLIGVYPDALAREELAAAVAVSETSGGFKNNLGALRTLGFIDYPAAGNVVATEVLFPASVTA